MSSAPTMAPTREATSHFTDLGGLRLHHLVWGQPDAPPLVLLHGLRGHAWSWERAARHLSPPHRLLALDFRGHGDSDWSEEGYGTPRYARDVAAWIDALGLERFDLIGHSAGGRVAVSYAASHRDRVRRLVVLDIGPDMEFQPFDPVLAALPRRVFDDLDHVIATLRQRYPTISGSYLRWLAARSVVPAADGGLHWKWDQRVRGQPPPPAQFIADLRALACPTLLVRGAQDGYLSAESAAGMQAMMADCRVAAIARAGHCLHEERPQTFANVVRAFLDEE